MQRRRRNHSQFQKHRPDLLFLDVQMPWIDGFGVLQEVQQEIVLAVIFTTAYDHYAVRMFEHDAVDYLLKPFLKSAFAKRWIAPGSSWEMSSHHAELVGRLLRELNAALQAPTGPAKAG